MEARRGGLGASHGASTPRRMKRSRPAREPAPDITIFIDAVRRRVEQTSVRHVAAELKMSHGGVHNLVCGSSSPYGKTLAKLRAWYSVQIAEGRVGFSREAALYLLPAMLSPIPAEQQPGACRDLAAALEELFRQYGTEPPLWVVAIREQSQLLHVERPARFRRANALREHPRPIASALG